MHTVIVLPEELVVTQDSDAYYLCTTSAETIIGIQWLLNNTLLEDLNVTDVRAVFSGNLGGSGRLIFSRIPLKYNSTNITCRAELITSRQIEVTVSLLVQGQ